MPLNFPQWVCESPSSRLLKQHNDFSDWRKTDMLNESSSSSCQTCNNKVPSKFDMGENSSRRCKDRRGSLSKQLSSGINSFLPLVRERLGRRCGFHYPFSLPRETHNQSVRRDSSPRQTLSHCNSHSWRVRAKHMAEIWLEISYYYVNLIVDYLNLSLLVPEHMYIEKVLF